MSDESIIIKKVLAGDVNAFAVLVTRYQDLALTLACNLLADVHHAEDTVQEAFIKAYSSLSTFQGNAKFATWFYRIVLNTALNKRKSKQLVYAAVDDYENEGEWQHENVDLCSYSNQQQRQYIQQALQHLREPERLCITLFYLHELSTDEIKDLTGYSLSNIKVLLFRGRKHMYNQLRFLLKGELRNII